METPSLVGPRQFGQSAAHPSPQIPSTATNATINVFMLSLLIFSYSLTAFRPYGTHPISLPILNLAFQKLLLKPNPNLYNVITCVVPYFNHGKGSESHF
jgi:hypothetical protein